MKKGMPETICFKCDRCDCCWMRELKPVSNWWAIEHKRKSHTSYRVISCPEYRKSTAKES